VKAPTLGRRARWTAIALASWPLLVAALFLTSAQPQNGQRWADANPGRGALLAATGMLWMTGVLLTGIWKLVFSVVVPALERSRASRSHAQ
jgi:hypothetical protein